MADLGIDLLDTGTTFILVARDIASVMEYGRFALTLINTDYDKILKRTTDFLKNKSPLYVAMDLQQGTFKDRTLDNSLANIILKPLFSDMVAAIGEGYLTDPQRKVIALLLLAEIRSKLTMGAIDLTAPTSYIPEIFCDKELHRHIRNLLLRKDDSFTAPISDRIAQMQISSSVIPSKSEDKGGEMLTDYHLMDISDYLMLDLQKYVSSSQQLRECQCCHRLFYPQFRRSEKYCRLAHKDTQLLCNEIMHNSPNDEFVKARNRARAYQKSRVNNASTKRQYDECFLILLYDNWSGECGTKFVEYKSKDDLQGFTDWIEATKFTADELKRLWAEYQAKGSTPYSGTADN